MTLSPDLQEIFPLTFSLLEAEKAEGLRAEFLKDWGVHNLHFFPMLLREKKYPPSVVETADYEFQMFYLKQESFPLRRDLGENIIVHPSCQFLHLQSAAAVLGWQRGLYVFWKNGERIEKKRLNLAEVSLLDRLQDDMILFRRDLSSDEVHVLESLLAIGIVCEGQVPSSPHAGF